MRTVVGDNHQRFKAVKRDVAPYFLPVPATEQDEHVRAFARQGMATVIRLPLRDEESARLVDSKVDELHWSEAPVLLFLPRVERLVLKSRGGAYPDQVTELERSASTIKTADLATSTEG